MKDHVQFNYNQITDEIFLGTNYCCKFHFDEDLAKQGIKADISLEAERLDQPFGVDHFLWLPTKDHTAPTLHSLALGVQMIHYLVEQKIKVYIHCMNGHGRAPSLVIAYMISKGKTLDEAIELVQKKRPEIHIEHPQLEQLKLFQTSIKW